MIIFAFIFGMLLTFVTYASYVFLIAFTLWMAIDAGKQDRFWWMVLIIGIPFVGGFAYYFTEKKHEYAKASPHHIHDSETESQHENAPSAHHRKHHTEEVVTPKVDAVTEMLAANTIPTPEEGK